MDDKKIKHKKEDEKVKELESKAQDFENQLKRAVADYRNLEKRIEEEKIEIIKFANKELLMRLMPAFDTLFRAEKYVGDEGLKLTIKKLIEVLKESGVKKIETVGHDFDPLFMECVDVVEGEENKVIEEITPGFTLYDKVICPAQVKVGKKKEEIDEQSEELAKGESQKGDYM